MSARAAELCPGSGRAPSAGTRITRARTPDQAPDSGSANSFYRLQWEPSRSQTDNPFFAHHEMGKIGHQAAWKNWCNGDIFWCWPSHMENELKATNKSYFGPRMLSCQGKKLIKSLDNHETSCRRFLSWNKIRPFEGHFNRFLCHQIKCFCFLFRGKAVANCILNRFWMQKNQNINIISNFDKRTVYQTHVKSIFISMTGPFLNIQFFLPKFCTVCFC